MGTNKGKDSKAMMDCGKYARYTPEQVEILERVYNDCPKPSSTRRQQLIRECPILVNIGQKQLKVWFQNRRCREKQRKETNRLQNWNSKLNAMNQILLEENERLQKQAAQLSSENQYLRQQLQLQQPNAELNHRVAHPVIMATTDTSSESVVTSGQHQPSPQHPSQDWSLSQLSALAERILAEFLAKATESVVDGIPLPGMKPGPDSIGAIALSRPCGGVAAQACGFVDLEPIKVSELVKNRPSWLQDCRRMDILATFAADRGGMVELIHTQMYAPTALVPARDFWTLRYTCCLDDGSLVICERSLAAGQGMQEIPITPGFLRAEMLSSGCLIRPFGQGGSMVMVVDDLSFNSGCSLSEGLQPLYTSSSVLARRMTVKVLGHLRNIVKEKADQFPSGNSSTALRGFSHRLVRGFNDAVNCFPDEGWVSIINDGPSSVSVQIKPPSCKQFGVTEVMPTTRGGIICAKADLLLPGVPPLLLVRFLRDRWTAWTDFDSDVCLHENAQKRKSVQVLQPIVGQNEVLEVVRLQRSKVSSEDVKPPHQDSLLLQLVSDMEDIAVNAYAQLIFAPIDACVPDDAPLLPSGFRVMHLDGHAERTASAQTLDLASTLEERSAINRMQVHNTRSAEEPSSVLTIAFQYMYEAESRDVALKAQRHVQALVDLIQQAALSLHPQQRSLATADTHSGVEALVLVQQIADSYRFHLGQELLASIEGSPEMSFKSFWTLRHAIVCCAWKPLPEFIFANHAALEMLETTSVALRQMSLEQMFNDGRGKTDYSQPPPFLQKEGYARLPAGVCLTSTGRPVSFEHATGWKVITNDRTIPVAAFMFCNWSFGSVQL